MNIYPVLLAGGAGTRLWPVSRELYPKQLVNFTGTDSLVQSTVKRLIPLLSKDKIRIVCNFKHEHAIAMHLQQIGIDSSKKIISEPCGCNTGPAILLGVLNILKIEKDAVICVFPADHIINDTESFNAKITEAVSIANKGSIVTFGIKAAYPETGYGYIEGSEPVSKNAFKIKRFVEKPDLETAEGYIKAGNFFWNSGMFAFKASVIINEFKEHQPELFSRLNSVLTEKSQPSLEEYQMLENISFDYAIMEHTQKGVVLSSDFGWSDIGSWKSLHDFTQKDENNNIITGDVITNNTKNCFIMSQNRLITANNLKDTIIIDTADALFVSDIENSREVKTIVKEIRAKGRKEHYKHCTEHHKWGMITSLERDTKSKTDRMSINLNSKALINTTVYATYIIVTQGTGRLTAGDKERILMPGDSAVVLKDDIAAIENIGDEVFSFIKIRT